MSKVIQSARAARVKASRNEPNWTELKARIQLGDASFMAPLVLYFALTVSIDHWHVIEFNLMKYFSQYVGGVAQIFNDVDLYFVAALVLVVALNEQIEQK